MDLTALRTNGRKIKGPRSTPSRGNRATELSLAVEKPASDAQAETTAHLGTAPAAGQVAAEGASTAAVHHTVTAAPSTTAALALDSTVELSPPDRVEGVAGSTQPEAVPRGATPQNGAVDAGKGQVGLPEAAAATAAASTGAHATDEAGPATASQPAAAVPAGEPAATEAADAAVKAEHPDTAAPGAAGAPLAAAAPSAAPAKGKAGVRKASETLDAPAGAEEGSPRQGRWPKKVKAGRALLEVTEDMLERSHKLPILLHWRWTGKSINAMYLYQRNIFQGYVGTATCDVPVDIDIDGNGAAVAAAPPDEDATDRAPFADGVAAPAEPEADALCALCGLPESKSRCIFSDTEAKLDAGHLVHCVDGGTTCWVHSKCAHFSHECAAVMRTHDEDSVDEPREEYTRQLHSALANAVRASKSRTCAVCQKSNASLRCCFCSKTFHYGCAVQANCFMDSAEPYKFTCRQHASRITDMVDPEMLAQMSAPSLYPPSLNALMAEYYANQQRVAAESNATTEMHTSDDEEGGDDEGTEGSSEQRVRDSSAGALETRSQPHLPSDKFPVQLPPGMMGMPGMRPADAMLYGGMRPMAFMDPHLRLQGPQAIGDPRMCLGPPLPAGEDQGEWCFDRFLGGTTGQKGRHGRCSVCLVQRKGRCGTESAPSSCMRVQAYLKAGKPVPSAPPKQSRKRVNLNANQFHADEQEDDSQEHE